MKVKDLIQFLEQFDPEHEIVIARDPEGNGFSPISNYEPDEALYEEKDGDVIYEADADDYGFEPGEFKANSVVLWPMY